MTFHKYPQIDGSKIVERKTGREDEWAKALHYLIDKDEQPGILLSKCRNALRVHSWLWNRLSSYEKKELVEDFRSFVLATWGYMYGFIPDDKGKFKKKMPKYNPQKGTFISYLLGSIKACHLSAKFIRSETTIANNYYQEEIEKIIREGRKKNKPQDEIDFDILKFNTSIWYISGMRHSDNADDFDNNSSASDLLVDNKQHLSLVFHNLENIFKYYIIYLNEKCENNKESENINDEYLQSGIQLYPEMIGVNQFDKKEEWIYSDQNQKVCKQIGIQWILQKTFNEIQPHNPTRHPWETLYDTFMEQMLLYTGKKEKSKPKAANSKNESKILKAYESADVEDEGDFKVAEVDFLATEEEDEKLEFNFYLKRIVNSFSFKMYFVPIKADALMGLLGITRNYANQQRRRYWFFFGKWLFDNREMLDDEYFYYC